MTTKAILSQIEIAMLYLTEDQKSAIELMQKSNLKKADDTVCFRENTGAILYELKLKLLSEIDKDSRSKFEAERIKIVKKLQEVAGKKPRDVSWQYAYYSVEDNLYLLMCDYFMFTTTIPDGLELISDPSKYRLIDWKKYNYMEYSQTTELPLIKELELYIEQQHETNKLSKKNGIRYVFPCGLVVNAEWLLWAMKLTGATHLSYNDLRKPCQLKGRDYTFTLMPAMRVDGLDAKPTELPKISGGAKKLF